MAAGQTRLLWSRQPIESLLADPATPAELRGTLAQVPRVRSFASALGLEVGNRYTAYAPWPGDRVVTTVVATRPGELEPAGFWFPIVGRVPYKGYFDPARAAAEAEQLRAQGLDVCEARVPAYSTLGWFDDPVTGPMLREGEGPLVETLFHELVHATFFVPGDADWSEGVASFVGEEASVRFHAESYGPEAGARERERVASQRRLRDALLEIRHEAEALYTATPPGAAREQARAALDLRAREQLGALLAAEGDPDASARTARLRTNDACLALAATYAGMTPCLAARLDLDRGDLAALVTELRTAAQAADPRAAIFGDASCGAPL